MNNNDNNSNVETLNASNVTPLPEISSPDKPNIVESIPIVDPTKVSPNVSKTPTSTAEPKITQVDAKPVDASKIGSSSVNTNVVAAPVNSSNVSASNVAPVSNSNVPNSNINSNINNGNNVSNGNNNDPDSVVNENLKKVEIEYTPPSKGRTAFTIMTFVFLIAFVIFLPDITNLVNDYKANKYATGEEVITTGTLDCTLSTNTTNLDMNYRRRFRYTDSKLNSANYTITTRGDITLDEETLNDLATKCKILEEYTDGVDGVEVSCEYTEGKLVEKQSYTFASINTEELDAAFAESGGTYPDFEAEQSIENVEKTMNAAGYSCVRKK